MSVLCVAQEFGRSESQKGSCIDDMTVFRRDSSDSREDVVADSFREREIREIMEINNAVTVWKTTLLVGLKLSKCFQVLTTVLSVNSFLAR